MLDDTWFNQTYWTIGGTSHSRLIVFDAESHYALKAFRGDRRHSRDTFAPGQKGYVLFAKNNRTGTTTWSIRVPVRVLAMVLAGDILFAAGSPDVVDPEDPWASIEGRKGGLLWCIRATNGDRVAEYQLDSPPVWDGMAAAAGRLYSAMQDGRVVCFGRRTP